MPTPQTEPDDVLLPDTRRALLHRVAVAQSRSRTPSLVAAVGPAGWCRQGGTDARLSPTAAGVARPAPRATAGTAWPVPCARHPVRGDL
ncbi:hypothetical protein ACIF70_38970 [Actinacidiphila glaucinigra]|uniref:hypothetical protein n=1 Tax=Actinacidiphila glaucinigra TaxID=235986 RepID=UPI0037C81B20